MLLQRIFGKIHRAVNEETSEFSFRGQLVVHPTAHQSVIPPDSFREHPAGDSVPSGRCLQWTGREQRQAGSLSSRGMGDLSESCGRRRHVTVCGNLSTQKKKKKKKGQSQRRHRTALTVESTRCSLCVSQPLRSLLWLSASTHAHKIAAGRILTAKS